MTPREPGTRPRGAVPLRGGAASETGRAPLPHRGPIGDALRKGNRSIGPLTPLPNSESHRCPCTAEVRGSSPRRSTRCPGAIPARRCRRPGPSRLRAGRAAGAPGRWRSPSASLTSVPVRACRRPLPRRGRSGSVNGKRAPRRAPSASMRRPRLGGPPLPAGLLEHLLVLVLAHGLAPFLDDRAHESLSMRAAARLPIRQ